MPSRRAFLSQLALLATAGAGAWWLRGHVLWPPPRVLFAEGRSSGWIPFADPSEPMAVVQARVNGTEVSALLDSGAQSSVLDRGLARRLGISTTPLGPVVLAFGVNGGPQLGRGATFDLDLPGLGLRGLHAAVFDLAPVTQASRRDFGLILGQDVLAQLVADIDFPRGRIAFHDPQGFTPPPAARRVPARIHGRELLVPVTVEKTALEVVLDTGASGALALSQATAEAAGLLSGRRVGAAPSIGFGGLAQDQVVRVAEVTFAGETLRDVVVHIYSPGRGAPIPAGLVGVETFDRLRLILDVKGGGVHVLPAGPEPSQRRRRAVMLQPI